MKPHLTESQLNDYVDGALDASGVAAADAHLRECEPCAAEVQSLRRLLAAAASLPLSLEPPAHLWSEVRDETSDVRRRSRRALRELRVPLAAAALLLVTTASGLTWWLAQDRSPARIAEAPAAAAPGGLGLDEAEAHYIEAARTLIRVLEQRRARTDPGIIQTVEENLLVTNEAILQAKSALESDPLNHDIAAILNATYQNQIQMLRRAVSLTGET
jgi:anti-sigma factor RsiW